MRIGFITAFFIKWISILASVLFIGFFFPLFGVMNWIQAILLGTAITIVGFVADLVIVPRSNNFVAVFVDFLIATFFVFAGNYIFPEMVVTWTFAIITGLLIAGVETFYHTKFLPKLT